MKETAADIVLQKVHAARDLLAQATSAPKAKQVVDIAAAAEVYARRQKLSQEAIDYAHEIKIEAMALLGEYLETAPKNAGARGIGTSAVPKQNRTVQTLTDIGVSKKESALSQHLAKVKREKPETFESVKQNKTAVKYAIKSLEKEKIIEQIAKEPEPLPDGPFRVITIDPPWQYTKRAEDATHRARLEYPDMTTDQICALPVIEAAHQDCILWLWTTNAFMRDAYKCLEAWDFADKTILTWVKNKMGTGDWLRGKTEHCIMAVRGRPTVKLTNQTTVIYGDVREHSRKPEEFYALVNELCPGSKLEMFARQKREGWKTWGAEHDKFF